MKRTDLELEAEYLTGFLNDEYSADEIGVFADHVIMETEFSCLDYNDYFGTKLPENIFRKAARVRILKEMGIIVVL